MVNRIRQKMVTNSDGPSRTDRVDMSFAEQGNPVIIGIRLVGNDVENRIEAALIGVLSYADESKRTVADVIEV